MTTKKKLRVRIRDLESTIERLESNVKDRREICTETKKEYKALQRAVCDLVDKADVIMVDKKTYVPNEYGW